MGYSLRTRSASKSEVETPKKTVAVAKPAAKKAAASKKVAEPKKIEKKTEIKKEAEPKKAVQAKKTAVEAKKATPAKPAVKKASVKAVAKKAAPGKTQAKKEVEKEVEIKKADSKTTEVKKVAAKKTEVKKVAAKKTEVKKAEAAKPAPVKKAAKVATKPAVKKASAPKKTAASKIVAPVVKIEEVSTPSLPDTEPILHAEPEEKIIEIVEGQVVSTHIRFSEDGNEDIELKQSPKATIEHFKESETAEEAPKAESPLEEGKIVEYSKDASITSSDFEALNDISEEPNHFDLYNSESETEELEPVGELVMDDFDEEEVKKESPVTNAHSAFDAFTSQEEPKTFNWGNPGSTYYKKNEEKPVEESKPVESPAPTVISNPFGFGFTATTATTATVTSAPAAVATSRPNPFSFNSHFQSVSSPLDKLCTLTSKANPIQVAGSSSFNFGTSSMGTSSFLPTSPAVGLSKAARSPSEKGDDREERSPSVIQSIIIDDKHEDFSAF